MFVQGREVQRKRSQPSVASITVHISVSVQGSVYLNPHGTFLFSAVSKFRGVAVASLAFAPAALHGVGWRFTCGRIGEADSAGGDGGCYGGRDGDDEEQGACCFSGFHPGPALRIGRPCVLRCGAVDLRWS